MDNTTIWDGIIIGGGFYGVSIASSLAKKMDFRKILIIEQESALFKRASYNNQARVHGGYHYPRSFTTAYRSRVNLPRFVNDFSKAIKKDFTSIYAIARRNSKVTSKQFERFCLSIGADFKTAPLEIKKLFEPRLIESAFCVEEYAFNSDLIRESAVSELSEQGIEVSYNTKAKDIFPLPNGSLRIDASKGNENVHLHGRYIFNCTYAGLKQFEAPFSPQIQLKQEVTEMALVQAPQELKNIGITVMDGPFFSIMPFPAKKLHSLSHVRYTPHFSWIDQKIQNPYSVLQDYEKESRADRMIRDVTRYIPSMSKAKVSESLFEVKTVLVKNEGDDGRPIFFEKNPQHPNFYTILGGKIDNIYDVLEKLDLEFF